MPLILLASKSRHTSTIIPTIYSVGLSSVRDGWLTEPSRLHKHVVFWRYSPFYILYNSKVRMPLIEEQYHRHF